MSHLDIESPLFEDKPHIWIQWKGTDVCCDIHCTCGYFGHYDGMFFYFFQCPKCKQVYECGTHISIYPIEKIPDGAIATLLDDNGDDEEESIL